MTSIQRLGVRFKEMRRASRFGFLFWRRGNFKIPSSIKMGYEWINLMHAHDRGSKEDFLSCFVDDVYGLSEIESKPKTILDIGANVGFFSLAARGLFPGATIHSYEPNSRVLRELEMNANAGRFMWHPEAVGATAGWVSMIDHSDSNQAQTSAVGSNNQDGILQVGLETAVERLGGQVDLLKMDCEGAEWDIFKATDAWRCIRDLRMEYHLTEGRTVDDVRLALEALSFRVIRQIDQQGFGLVWATHA